MVVSVQDLAVASGDAVAETGEGYSYGPRVTAIGRAAGATGTGTDMNIGEAAKRAGVNAKAIRYYESIGLLPEPARTESGYRVYSQDDVERLRMIGRARRLGFGIEDVKRLLTIYSESREERSGVKTMVMQHVSEIDEKIAELNAIRATLLDLAQRCDEDEIGELSALAGERHGSAAGTRAGSSAQEEELDGGGDDGGAAAFESNRAASVKSSA
jgi:MerR family copper efflux transcriptional regulator